MSWWGGTFAAPTYWASSKSVRSFTWRWGDIIIITFFQVEVYFLKDEFAFLVLLTWLISFHISPANQVFASLAKDVAYTMKACYEGSLLGRSNIDVHTMVKQVSTAYWKQKRLETPLGFLAILKNTNRLTMFSMKTLWDNLVVTCEVCSTLSTGINLRSVQVNHRVVEPSSTSWLGLR